MRCRNCKKKISKFAKCCPYCNMDVQIVGSETKEWEEYIADIMDGKFRSCDRVGHKKKCLTFRSIAAVVCAMVAMFICVSSWYGKVCTREYDRGLVYYVQEQKLFVRSLESGREKVLSKQISRSLTNEAAKKIEANVYHEDSKRNIIYYAADILDRPMVSYRLYAQSSLHLDEEPKVIGENVRMQTYDQEGNLYFVTTDTAYLYRYDGQEVHKVELAFAERLLYEKTTDSLVVVTKKCKRNSVNKDNTYSHQLDERWCGIKAHHDIVLVDCKSLVTRNKLEQFDGELVVTSKHDIIYYMKNNQLYRLDVVNDQTDMIQKAVSSFALTKQDELYYVTYRLKKKSYYDFISDPYAEKDEKVGHGRGAIHRKKCRDQLKDKRVRVFDGELHCLKGGKDRVVESHVAKVWKEPGQQGVLLCYNREDVVLSHMAETQPELVNVDLEKYFFNPAESLGETRGVTLYLYDYDEAALAIPEVQEAYCFWEEKNYEYDPETNQVKSVM